MIPLPSDEARIVCRENGSVDWTVDSESGVNPGFCQTGSPWLHKTTLDTPLLVQARQMALEDQPVDMVRLPYPRRMRVLEH